jgi:hypothetical protein
VNEYVQGLPVLRANDGPHNKIERLINTLGQNTKPKLIYHFCLAGQPETGNPLAFVRHSLVPQLAQYFNEEAIRKKFGPEQLQDFGKDYYAWCRQGKFPLLVGNADDSLRYFVLEPLRKFKEICETLPDKDYEPPVIVIDGIDFIPSGHSSDNSILGLLLRYRDELDDVARFLVTADAAEEYATSKERLVSQDIHRLTYHHRKSPDLIISSQ